MDKLLKREEDRDYTQTIISFELFRWVIITINCFGVDDLERCIDWSRHSASNVCENYIDWKGIRYLHKVASEIKRNQGQDLDIMHKAWEAEKVFKVLA